MNYIKFSNFTPGDEGAKTEITITGEQENNTELIIHAIKTLMEEIDLKHAAGGDHLTFNNYVETLLLSVADIVGYESYYFEQVPDSEKSYNDSDELVVSRSEKVKLLKQLVESL